MTFSEPLSQYEEILKDAIRTSVKESGAKLAKTFQNLLIEILTLYMIPMAKVKSLMFNANYTKLIFDMSRCRPNRTLISKIVKELIGWQPKTA